MTNPTDDQYRDAAIITPNTLIEHGAEVIRANDGAYVAVRIWVAAGTAKTLNEK